MIEYLSLHRGHAPVAQMVEHLTFNQGVRSSTLRRSTNIYLIRSEHCTVIGSYYFYSNFKRMSEQYREVKTN